MKFDFQRYIPYLSTLLLDNKFRPSIFINQSYVLMDGHKLSVKDLDNLKEYYSIAIKIISELDTIGIKADRLSFGKYFIIVNRIELAKKYLIITRKGE